MALLIKNGGYAFLIRLYNLIKTNQGLTEINRAN